jgi:hypothetical protein
MLTASLHHAVPGPSGERSGTAVVIPSSEDIRVNIQEVKAELVLRIANAMTPKADSRRLGAMQARIVRPVTSSGSAVRKHDIPKLEISSTSSPACFSMGPAISSPLSFELPTQELNDACTQTEESPEIEASGAIVGEIATAPKFESAAFGTTLDVTPAVAAEFDLGERYSRAEAALAS